MYAVLIVIHIIVSIFLIAVILLQAGRGGGLADSFGGSQMQSLFGTKSANVLTRLTTGCAAAFIITCLMLAVISSRRSKSIIEKVNIPPPVKTETVEEVVIPKEIVPIQEETVLPEVVEEVTTEEVVIPEGEVKPETVLPVDQE